MLASPCPLGLTKHINDEVLKRKQPTTRTELYSFMRLCNICRQFVPNFSWLAGFLDKQLYNVHWRQFGPLHNTDSAAVLYLEDSSKSTSVLALVKSECRYTRDTNPCEKNTLYVLPWEQEAVSSHLLGYCSHTTRHWENINYCVQGAPGTSLSRHTLHPLL